jgi:hypothetical protein
MSRHIGRKQRWTRDDACQYTCDLGQVVYAKAAWFGLLEYKTVIPVTNGTALPSWLSHLVRLGPFKRPRNAMIAVEREATMLRNRHGKHIVFERRTGKHAPERA